MNCRAKTVTAALIFSLLLAIFLLPSFEGARQYSVTDAENGEVFAVTDNNGEITIATNGKECEFFIDYKTVDVCCFDSVFTFLCTAETAQKDNVYSIYTYNRNTGALDSFTTNCKVARNNDVFAADSKGNIYILNTNDSTLIHCFKGSQKVSEITCGSTVTQMICVGKEKVLLFSVDGVYLLKDSCLAKISPLVPVYPCIYSEDGIITDHAGDIYIFEADSFDIYKEETKPANFTSPYGGDVAFDRTKKIITVSAGTTVAGVFEYFGINSEDVILKKADGSIIASGKLSTGMTVVAEGSAYPVIVYGDLTGEGNVNSRDLDALMKHLTEEVLLSGEFETAADLDKDNIISTKDLLALARLY